MGTFNYKVITDFGETRHTEISSREEALQDIDKVKKNWCPVSNNIYHLNGDITLDMKGQYYHIQGEFKHISNNLKN